MDRDFAKAMAATVIFIVIVALVLTASNVYTMNVKAALYRECLATAERIGELQTSRTTLNCDMPK